MATRAMSLAYVRVLIIVHRQFSTSSMTYVGFTDVQVGVEETVGLKMFWSRVV